MQLIGHYSSPFVRRVAVTAIILGIDLEHRALSVFREFDKIRAINPLVKVPSLLLDDGSMLMDSSIIIDHLESIANSKVELMPRNADDVLKARQLTAIALAVNEKTAAIIYETSQRPADKQHGPWIERLQQQLRGGLALLEKGVTGVDHWLFGSALSQADITVAITWRFVLSIDAVAIRETDYPALTAYSKRAEQTPAFMACQP